MDWCRRIWYTHVLHHTKQTSSRMLIIKFRDINVPRVRVLAKAQHLNTG